MSLEKNFKHQHQLSVDEINKLAKTKLVDPKEFENIKFETTISEMGFDVDNVQDPKIKAKIVELLKKDMLKQDKLKSRQNKKFIKNQGTYLKKQFAKDKKSLDKIMSEINKEIK